MVEPPKSAPATKILRKSLKTWSKGLVSAFNEDRIPEDGFAQLDNCITDNNGTVTTRGRFRSQSYIPDLPAPILGELFNYTYDGETDGLCGIMADQEDASHFYYLDSRNRVWVRDNAAFAPGAKASMTQISNKVIICNDVDRMCYFDINTKSITKLQQIANPTVAPTLAKTGFSGTDTRRYYYVYTWSTVNGETAMSPPAYVDLPLRRAGWDKATVKITIPTLPAGAVSYNVYTFDTSVSNPTPPLSVDEWLLIALAQTGTTFVDDSSLTPQLIRPPEENTTGGIIANFVNNINGILWAIASGKRVHWGGIEGHELDFSLSNGGGYKIVGNGGLYTPVVIFRSRTDTGTVCNAILCSGTNGNGKRYNVLPITVTFNGSNRDTYSIEEVRGDDGTSAPLAVVDYLNNLYYPTTYGFKSTGVRQNISNSNVTDLISRQIADKAKQINFFSLKDCVAAVFEDRIFWTVAYGSQKNNQIWVYDVLRGGIWSIWDAECDYLFAYTAYTTTAVTKLYMVRGRKIYEYSEAPEYEKVDTAFKPQAQSGILYFDPEDGRQWVRMLQAIITLYSPRGQIHIDLDVKTRRGIKTYSGEVEYPVPSAVNPLRHIKWSSGTPWGDRAKWSGNNAGENIVELSTGLNDIQVKVNKDVQWVKYRVWSDDPSAVFTLTSVAFEYVNIGVGLDFSSHNNMKRLR